MPENGKSNLRPRRQATSLIGVSLINIALIAGLFAAFYFFFLGNKREYIAHRNFRILDEVGRQFNDRLVHFRALFQYFRITGLEEYEDYVVDNKKPGNLPEVPTLWNHIVRQHEFLGALCGWGSDANPRETNMDQGDTDTVLTPSEITDYSKS